MKQMLAWLETKLSRFKSPDLPDTSGRGKSNELDLGVDLPKELRDLVNDVPTTAGAHDDTVPNLRTLDPDTSPGFDPYDTAKLHKK